MSYLLADGWIITMNAQRDILEQASLVIEGNRISAIGTREALQQRYPEAEIINCRERIIMPGMVNTHTHLFQTLLKGLGDDMVLKKWFTCMTGPSAVALTEEDVYAAALHGCVESLRSGVTSLVDFMYAHPRPGLTAKVIEAFEVSGIRGHVCRGFLTSGAEHGIPAELIETPEQALADARNIIQRFHKADGRVKVGLAPSMIWALDEKVLRGTRELANETGVLITTHVAETDFEIEQSRLRFQATDTEFLSDIGFLGRDVLAVHCVQCSSRDIRALKHHDTRVSHNPCSNLYLASGVPPIPEMLASGLTVGLGSDGPASSNNHSLFQAMKVAALMQKGVHRDPTIMTAEKVLEMATIDGARAIGLDHLVGSLEVGKRADVVIVDTSHPAMTPIHHPVSSLVYSALGHEVSDVFVDGVCLLRAGEFTQINQQAVMAQSQRVAHSLAVRTGNHKVRQWRSSTF
ncbi:MULTISPECIES: amidohydrolase family protein [Klebsiella pneumoniae complex]|jgi:5-methylthioadenosine/S-adenosylhomocysteine deaminase|uniref:amidohydrolase family protein n=1 Tax=Klebsiella pneumoniae complex TaxID=3390273 RepID=UPI0007CA5B39|nr:MULTISPECIES: amidohydrolase [Klebsiella]MDP1091693.1 amidohydrolase [Klebsiella pneumoniae]TYG05734.1 amidohydrolase [Klebsiella variicola]SAT49048.1 amidohydrolase [Klebsiella pneumoniae]HBY0021417.1 amidohydrolase [Klebsiella pneumoniae]HCD6356336.1 amidohydrolase [Klebsiella variicola]